MDGEILKPSAGYFADTVNVAPGRGYDVIWKARERGKWLIQFHIGDYTANNNVETQGGSGLFMIIDVK